MKSIILCDMMPCSPLNFNRRFGGTFHHHLQGRRNKFSKTSKQAGGKQNSACFGGTYRLHLQCRRNNFSKKPASKQIYIDYSARK
jgi:hypothetical protein